MNSIYHQLCRDHKHMQQLLDTFEKLLHQLGKPDRDPATLSLILDALDYISVYPNKWHHPVEDLVFEQLLTKPIQNRDAVIATGVEHRRITVATQQMNILFYAIANDAAVERSELLGRAMNYLTLQRSHMHREIHIVFPLIEQHLTSADWDAISQKLHKQQDPLFNPGIKKLYESVYEYLVRPGISITASAGYFPRRPYENFQPPRHFYRYRTHRL